MNPPLANPVTWRCSLQLRASHSAENVPLKRGHLRGYLPTFDGWRAIAILSVIAFHDKVRHIGPFSDAFAHGNGDLGVDIFFAISGVLICSRLLDEEARFGSISLRHFYVRRAFRILPAFLVCVAALGALSFFHILRIGAAPLLSSLLFVQNYYFAHLRNPAVSPYTNHFWSLSIEEHFYLLLPWILYFVRRRRALVLGGLTLVACAYPVFIFAHPAWWHLMGGSYSGYRTEMRIHALLFPALLAVLLRKPAFKSWCRRALILAPFPVLVIQLILLQLLPAVGLGDLLLLVIPVGFPFLILGTSLHPENYFSRLLEWAPVRYLGRISYSLYLWQQLFFIGNHEQERAAGFLGHLQGKPWSLAVALLIAMASYYAVEKPLVRLGHKISERYHPRFSKGRSRDEHGLQSPHVDQIGVA